MRTRRKARSLTDYRTVMASTGDYGVGAYVRRQQRRNIIVMASGLALFLVAGVLYTLLRPEDPPAQTGGYETYVRCVAKGCDYEGPMTVTAAQDFPVDCPKCGRRSCQQVWQCRACGAKFLPEGMPESVRCPKCGSLRVGSAVVRPAETAP
ncbi:MAG: hypothetical protein KKB50_02315 [Planctomycetes bacterium]|nr:hypothetical protein [Planctomycetota bacterium]